MSALTAGRKITLFSYRNRSQSLNSTVPSTTAFVKLIQNLCKETDVSILFSALRTGLLINRYSICTENWKSIVDHFEKIPKRTSSNKKENEENKQEKVTFEYFDDDYMPTDMVSNIFQYLDTLSQCQVNKGFFSSFYLFFSISLSVLYQYFNQLVLCQIGVGQFLKVATLRCS